MGYVARRTKGAAGQPLFLTFHGTGGTEDQFHGLARQLLPAVHVSSPRGDVSEYGALRYFARTGEGIYDMDDLATRTTTMADFIAGEAASTNPSRVIGLGYSNGANILASVALKHPLLVDDMILMHPLIPWAPEPQQGLSGRRVLITAGRSDPICPTAETQALGDYFAKQGAEVTLHWHNGGHEIASEEIDAVQDFLTS